jgi:hypothetical protein
MNYDMLYYPVALFNDLICRGSLEGANTWSCSWTVGSLHRNFFLINVTSTTRFDLLWSSSGKYFYVSASLYCFLSFHCSERSGCVMFEVYTLPAVVLCGFR